MFKIYILKLFWIKNWVIWTHDPDFQVRVIMIHLVSIT